MRVSSVDQPTITDSSDAAFEIQSPAAKVIYINDGSTANDTWCFGVGAPTNTGLSAVSPLDSFQSVIEHYPPIGAGDELRVDTGVFDVGRTVYLNQQNSGAAGRRWSFAAAPAARPFSIARTRRRTRSSSTGSATSGSSG